MARTHLSRPTDASTGFWAEVLTKVDEHDTDLDSVDAVAPTAGQKAALAGSSGTPGAGNKYVTDADSRNTDTRTPTDGSVTNAKLGAQAVTFSTAKAFVSGQTNATGALQNIAHGLGAVPACVLVAIDAGHDGAGGAGTQCPGVTYGVHTDTNVSVQISQGAQFRVFAWV